MANTPKSARKHAKASTAWDKAADRDNAKAFEAADRRLKATLAHTNRDYQRGVRRCAGGRPCPDCRKGH